MFVKSEATSESRGDVTLLHMLSANYLVIRTVKFGFSLNRAFSKCRRTTTAGTTSFSRSNHFYISGKMNRVSIGLVAIAEGSAAQKASANGTAEVQIKLFNTSSTVAAATAATTMMTNGDKCDLNKNVAQAIEVLKSSDVVCFDVDSTVIKEEGIDELAKFCGKGAEVARLTKEAMGGSMSFEQALTRRLNIIRPSQQQIREFLKMHPSTITSGLRELIAQLKSENKQIFLITGGFDCLINPVAEQIGIPLENVYANKLHFYFDGNYACFDTTQPTSRSGGKGVAIAHIRQTLPTSHKVTMIGDGATDLEAAPPADNFIGFGGNVVREEVRNRSQYYVTDFKHLLW